MAGIVSIVVGLAGRLVELPASDEPLRRALALRAETQPPPGSLWSAVWRGAVVELSRPLSDFAGDLLTLVAVPELLDWCDAQGCDDAAFAACGLVHPGDAVVCLVTHWRVRLSEPASRLVALGETKNVAPMNCVQPDPCVHAVALSGRSVCLNYGGKCTLAAAFRAAEDHGGPTAFAAVPGAALMLCADGALLRCAGPWHRGFFGAVEVVAGRFLQVASEAYTLPRCRVAALSTDGEVFSWSARDAAQAEGRAARLLSCGAPRRVLAVDEGGALRLLGERSPQLDSLVRRFAALTVPRGGCAALTAARSSRGQMWPLALTRDGAAVAFSLEDSPSSEAEARALQLRLDAATGRSRCRRLECFHNLALLLLEDGRLEAVLVGPGPAALRVPEGGAIADLLVARFGVLIRFVDGRREWAWHALRSREREPEEEN